LARTEVQAFINLYYLRLGGGKGKEVPGKGQGGSRHQAQGGRRRIGVGDADRCLCRPVTQRHSPRVHLQSHLPGCAPLCFVLGCWPRAASPAPRGQVTQPVRLPRVFQACPSLTTSPWPRCSGWHRPEQHSCPRGQTPASGTLVHNGAARVQAGTLVNSLSCQLLIKHRDRAHLLPKMTPDELSSPSWRLCCSNWKHCRRKQRNQCQVPALSVLTLLLRTKSLLASIPGPAEHKARPREKGTVSAPG